VFAVALMAKSKSRIPLLCYVITNVISIILWGISLLFIDNNSHFALWYVGLFVELVVNLIVKDKRLSWAASHLAERFGLLTLIVLGKIHHLGETCILLYVNNMSTGENLMGFVKLVAEAGTTIYVV
jgi:low temperature requirement protein LtrA